VRQLFNPASIVLVGATDKSSWSRAFYANLVQSGFAGAVHLVNPRGGIVHDQQSYRSVADLPEPADLAIVMVPTGAVLDVMGEIADAGIRSAVVLTAGFGEVGEEGARLEEQLRALARERGITVLGPNGNGFVNVAAGITPYGLPLSDQIPQGRSASCCRAGRSRARCCARRGAQRGPQPARRHGQRVDAVDDRRDRLPRRRRGHQVVLLFVESIRDPERFREVARRHSRPASR
jgi:acyl-CoA synthetase (NDP forming)